MDGVERDRVADELGRFDPEAPVEEAWTPPASWYLEPAFLERERRTVFRRNWLVACRRETVARPGAFASGELLGESWLVVRGADGVLRAFHNVCRHHATRLVAGEGELETIVCPYHAWTYELDGRLASAPHLGGVRGFDRARFGLVPIELAEWGPYVFLHLGPEPGSLDAELAGLGRQLEERDSFGLAFAARRRYEVGCNWKVFVDNYLDGGYHVPHLHRGLAAHLDLSRYRTEVFERYSVQSCPGGASADERIGQEALYAWVHPNLMINRYGPVMDVNLVRPLATDRTEVVFDFFLEEPVDPAFLERCLAQSDTVQDEDARVCEEVQAGLHSSSFDRGRYAPRLEHGAHHFHRLLAAELGDEP